ncbi:MAG: hypothetical protein ACFFBC_00490 [Promethearchaeota archaeon]
MNIYDLKLLNKIITGLENIKKSLDNEYINVYSPKKELDGLRHFEYQNNELIMAKFPGQEEPTPCQRILEHGKQIPFDYNWNY